MYEFPKRKITGYGWKPDLPDFRDHLYAVTKPVPVPPSLDLSTDPAMPPVYDQGALGACTGNGIGAVVAFEIKQATGKDFQPSRLFIYYGERVIENTVSQDAGAAIRDGIKVVNKAGCPPESDWPYDIKKFAQQPPQQAFADALGERAVSYARVARTQIKRALVARNLVVFGFSVFSSFESQEVANTGLLNLPQRGEQNLGGHCTVICGYDDHKVIASQPPGAWKVRNSWGKNWGEDGYFWMPYGYTAKSSLSSDFWTISAVGK